MLAGYADMVHLQNGHARWPMGTRSIDRLNALLAEALPDAEIARLRRIGAAYSEDQAMTLALAG